MNTSRKIWAFVAAIILCPLVTQAHPAGGAVNGWQDGFNHPLHGWDHLIAMVAVGMWAAMQRGRARWLIPLTFVSVMTLGGVAGSAGSGLPGIELAITLSVVVFVALVARCVRLSLGWGAAIVGFFAFFHGYAHGSEMPPSVGLGTFGLGFVMATILLHGVGWLSARLVALAVLCFSSNAAFAQENANSPAANSSTNAQSSVRLPEVVVTGRQDSLLGIAESATQGSVGAAQLKERPILRSGEILETVPGVIITQHAGGGKANQYFLRGFNLDHGTDFATSIDGMPLNLPSHAHGQGYADMNIVIPEFVQRVDFEKGPYYAANGDFSSVGAAQLVSFKTLSANFVTIEAGTYGYERGVFGLSQKAGDGDVVLGGELYHDDGPWKRPDDYSKFNGLISYSRGDDTAGYSVTARAYHGKWNSSDQIAESFAQTDFFGTLNPTDGGNSQRYSLQGEWHAKDDQSATTVNAYGFYYDLDLFSDFTYYLTDTNRGDQFEQADRRWVAGVDARHTLFGRFMGREMENTFGLQVRNDWIQNGLYQTENRARVDKIDSATGDILPAVTRADDLTETSIGLFYENKMQWAEKFRSVAGIRGDVNYFGVHSSDQRNSGSATAALPSPKLSLILGPWAKTEVYVQGGFGYHSNDGRGTTTTLNPDGSSGTKIDGLIQTRGAEVGIRTLAVPKLQSTLSLWYLRSDSELLLEGDTGNTIPTKQPSDRYGIEWANYYNPTKHLTFDLDFANSIARFTEPDSDGGTHVPEAIESVISAGITLHDLHGFTSSLRLRYFGPRDLISDGSFRSAETILLNAQVGYQINKTWSLSAEALNLLDRRDQDIAYAYESRVTPSYVSSTQVHLHPVEPLQFRFGIHAQF